MPTKENSVMHAEFCQEIGIRFPVEKTFPLFTPKGEEMWVPGWRPEYLSPTSGETAEEMIFRTGNGDEETLWTCLKLRPDEWHVRYLRVTPASRVAFVDVRCSPDGPMATRVRIAYSYLALSDAGRRLIGAMSKLSFAAMIDEWATMINHHDGAAKTQKHMSVHHGA
jgi:hypothetical protein